MRELIGQCCLCGRSIYCENGFLNGYAEGNGQLRCFEHEHQENSKQTARSENDRDNATVYT